jgi:hypothetical protein
VKWAGLPRVVAVGCAVLLGLTAFGARADQWSFENTLSSRFEVNDNSSLVTHPSGTVNSLFLTTAFKAARSQENAATAINGTLTKVLQPGADRFDGAFALSQSLSDEVNNWSAGASFTQDFNNQVATADVAVGRGQRRAGALNASWSRQLSERLSLGTSASLSGTAFGTTLSNATDFRDVTVSGSVSYRLTELSSFTVDGSHSVVKSAGGANGSVTNDFSLGLTRALSEQTSTSLSLGAFRTEQNTEGVRYACPVQVIFCEFGLVPFTPVKVTARTTGTGLTFTSTYSHQFDEITGITFSTGSKQTPSGAGTLQRSDTLNLGFSRSLSETASTTAAYSYSRSRAIGARLNGASVQQSLSFGYSRQLTPDLSFSSGYVWTQANTVGADNTARSNAVSITLQYGWPKIQAAR